MANTGIGPLFCLGNERDALRVEQGRLNPVAVKRPELGAFYGSSYSIAAPSMTEGENPVSLEALGEFLHCGVGEFEHLSDLAVIEIPGHFRSADEDRVFEIKLVSPDGIYVLEHMAYETSINARRAAIGPSANLTEADLNNAKRVRALTLVSLADYDGSFELPVVVAKRPLGFSEVGDIKVLRTTN